MAKEKDPTTTEPTPAARTFRVVWSGLTDAAGQLRRRDDVLTAEEIGNVALHLERGAIVEVAAEKADESKA